jgi:hypothetical protein
MGWENGVPGLERISMVKNRDIKGALSNDAALREAVEKQVGHGAK